MSFLRAHREGVHAGHSVLQILAASGSTELARLRSASVVFQTLVSSSWFNADQSCTLLAAWLLQVSSATIDGLCTECYRYRGFAIFGWSVPAPRCRFYWLPCLFTRRLDNSTLWIYSPAQWVPSPAVTEWRFECLFSLTVYVELIMCHS